MKTENKIIRMNFAALLVATFCLLFKAESATVYSTNLVDSLGVVSGVSQVNFIPVSRTPQQYGNQTVLPKPVAAFCDTNSGFAANIIAGGVYSVSFYPPNSYVTPVNVVVPSNDTNSYTLNQVIAAYVANKNLFIYTNGSLLLAGTNVVFTTDGLYLVINAAGGGGSGTTYTFTPTNLPVSSAWVTNGATVFYPTNATGLATPASVAAQILTASNAAAGSGLVANASYATAAGGAALATYALAAPLTPGQSNVLASAVTNYNVVVIHPNGSNDTAAIQAVLNTNGVVSLDAGATYFITNLWCLSGGIEGHYATLKKLSCASLNASLSVYYTNFDAMVYVGIKSSGVNPQFGTNPFVHNVVFDGGQSYQASIVGYVGAYNGNGVGTAFGYGDGKNIICSSTNWNGCLFDMGAGGEVTGCFAQNWTGVGYWLCNRNDQQAYHHPMGRFTGNFAQTASCGLYAFSTADFMQDVTGYGNAEYCLVSDYIANNCGVGAEMSAANAMLDGFNINFSSIPVCLGFEFGNRPAHGRIANGTMNHNLGGFLLETDAGGEQVENILEIYSPENVTGNNANYVKGAINFKNCILSAVIVDNSRPDNTNQAVAFVGGEVSSLSVTNGYLRLTGSQLDSKINTVNCSGIVGNGNGVAYAYTNFFTDVVDTNGAGFATEFDNHQLYAPENPVWAKLTDATNAATGVYNANSKNYATNGNSLDATKLTGTLPLESLPSQVVTQSMAGVSVTLNGSIIAGGGLSNGATIYGGNFQAVNLTGTNTINSGGNALNINNGGALNFASGAIVNGLQLPLSAVTNAGTLASQNTVTGSQVIGSVASATNLSTAPTVTLNLSGLTGNGTADTKANVTLNLTNTGTSSISNLLASPLTISGTNVTINLAGYSNSVSQCAFYVQATTNLWFNAVTNAPAGFNFSVEISQVGTFTEGFDTNSYPNQAGWAPPAFGQILTLPTNSTLCRQILSVQIGRTGTNAYFNQLNFVR